MLAVLFFCDCSAVCCPYSKCLLVKSLICALYSEPALTLFRANAVNTNDLSLFKRQLKYFLISHRATYYA